MKRRILSTLAVAIAMALPVAGAAAVTGGADAEVAAQADAGAVAIQAAASAGVRATVPTPDAPPASDLPDAPPATDAPPVPDTPATPDVTAPPAPAVPLPGTGASDPSHPAEEPQRETFPVRDAGTVTVTWVPDAILELEAHPERGWRHHVHRQDRRTGHVWFTDGQRDLLFTASVTQDGQLHTHVAERTPTTHDPSREVDTRTVEVGEAGTVTITYSAYGIHQVEVAANDGWQHRVHRDDDRRSAHVGFWDGQTGSVLSAHVTPDGQLHTSVHDRDAS